MAAPIKKEDEIAPIELEDEVVSVNSPLSSYWFSSGEAEHSHLSIESEAKETREEADDKKSAQDILKEVIGSDLQNALETTGDERARDWGETKDMRKKRSDRTKEN